MRLGAIVPVSLLTCSDAATQANRPPSPSRQPSTRRTSSPTQSKGRPTPKRRDAEAARKSKIAPPKDRREAKQRMREERSKERKQVDAALKSGDERHYPPRDQGKPKALARNWIDGTAQRGRVPLAGCHRCSHRPAHPNPGTAERVHLGADGLLRRRHRGHSTFALWTTKCVG